MDANIMISGGAKGSDKIFQKYAEHMKHKIIIYRPQIRVTSSRIYGNKIVYMEPEDCDINGPLGIIVSHANKTIGRTFPSKNDIVNQLLLRTAKSFHSGEHIIPQSLYAFVRFGDTSGNKILGGTAWGVQIFLDYYVKMFVIDQYISNLPVYLLNVGTTEWLKHDYSYWDDNKDKMITNWKKTNKVPAPSGCYMGIGTREIPTNQEFGYLQMLKELW